MRKTRFMSMVLLVLAGSFFLLPEFRQALQAPIFALESWQLLYNAGRLGPGTLRELAAEAERRRDARLLAFVVLHTGDELERMRLAARTVELDPKLTWIYWNPGSPQRNRDEKLEREKCARLQAWDPDNAVPYLYQAERVFELKGLDKQLIGVHAGAESALAGETEWRQLMEKAFAANRIDAYGRRRFELERTVLREHGLDRPLVMLASAAEYSIPNLLNVREYGKLLLHLGKQAEQSGNAQEALRHYWTVAHFAERMQLQSPILIERLIGIALRSDSYERLIPLVRQAGRLDEAASLQFSLDQLRQGLDVWAGKDPLAQSANYNWTALVLHSFAALVVVFMLFTVASVGYVNLKRRVRPEVRGRLYQVLTDLENYAPVMLLLACLGLYISYYPYAQNFRHYMTAPGEIHDFEPLFYNVFPSYGGVPGHNHLPFGNPLLPYVWYALGGLTIALLGSRLLKSRGSAQPAAGDASAPGA